MPDTQQRVLKLVRGLIAKTDRGEIKWQPSEEWNDLFSTDTPSTVIFVDSRDDDGEPPYRLRIDAKPGERTIHEVTMTSHPADATDIELNQSLRRLYEKARNTALGIDATLDKVLNELDID